MKMICHGISSKNPLADYGHHKKIIYKVLSYFCRWSFQLKPTKREVCAFHLNIRQANAQLYLVSDGVQLLLTSTLNI